MEPGRPRLEWLPEPSPVRAEDILDADDSEVSSQEGANKTEEAERLLKEMLSSGWRLSKDVDAAALELSISLPTLNRARKNLGGQARNIAPGKRGQFWVTWLPSVVTDSFNGETFDPDTDPEIQRILRERKGLQP
jgi:hypothetical protein